MKKLTVALLIATMLLGMTACGSSANQSASATETQTQTTMSEDEINARMNDLANQENDIIAEHQDLWNTVFNSMDKEEAKNSTENNYGKFLETQLDKIVTMREKSSRARRKSRRLRIRWRNSLHRNLRRRRIPLRLRLAKAQENSLISQQRILTEMQWTAASSHRTP